MHSSDFSAVDSSVISRLIMMFETGNHIVNNNMDKVLLPDTKEFTDIAHDIIENKIGIKGNYKIVGDNFYKHHYSYFPHCDAVESTAWLNIVIPLARYNSKEEQKFVVFDQRWFGNNATWVGSYNMEGDFYSNKKIHDRPCDGLHIKGCTDNPLPNDLWNHLNENMYLTQNYLFGLTGHAYTWEPGRIIVFDSRHIHATGNMKSTSKLGLSIRIVHA